MSRAQQDEHNKQMELPVNKFLNMMNDKGEIKYEIASVVRKYALSNPDPALDQMRLCNALVHELRVHKKRAMDYLSAYESNNPIELRNEHGTILDKGDCYLRYVAERQNCHLVLSKLRAQLIGKLLEKCDGDVFTFDQYNDYVIKCIARVKEMGYELFPVNVEIIEPL